MLHRDNKQTPGADVITCEMHLPAARNKQGRVDGCKQILQCELQSKQRWLSLRQPVASKLESLAVAALAVTELASLLF